MYVTQDSCRNGLPCHWCSRPMNYNDTWLHDGKAVRGKLYPTKDHVTPRSHGGKAMVWACNACNRMKGSLSEQEWAQFMRDHPEWWRKLTKALAPGEGFEPRPTA